MIKVALTGNIGSGKSMIASIFELLNVPVYYADLASKKILDLESTKESLLSAFGGTILTKNNSIDKKALAAIVFHDKKALQALNAIMHPLVADDFDQWCSEHQQSPYVIQEAAVVIESGSWKKFDKIILVSAPKQLRLERVMKRDQVSEKEVLARMANQMSEGDKVSYADYFIINDGTQFLMDQILKIHKQLI